MTAYTIYFYANTDKVADSTFDYLQKCFPGGYRSENPESRLYRVGIVVSGIQTVITFMEAIPKETPCDFYVIFPDRKKVLIYDDSHKDFDVIRALDYEYEYEFKKSYFGMHIINHDDEAAMICCGLNSYLSNPNVVSKSLNEMRIISRSDELRYSVITNRDVEWKLIDEVYAADDVPIKRVIKHVTGEVIVVVFDKQSTIRDVSAILDALQYPICTIVCIPPNTDNGLVAHISKSYNSLIVHSESESDSALHMILATLAYYIRNIRDISRSRALHSEY